MNRLVAALVSATLVAPLAAAAHTPGRLEPNSPFDVPDPKVSYAMYGELFTGEEVFRIRLSLDERFALPVEIFVPHAAKLREHRPAYAVVAKGLPAPSAEELAALPRPLPAGWGAIVELNQVSPRPVFFESFLRRFYWTSGAIAIALPAGEVEIWIWAPVKSKGKFGLGFGVEEGGGYGAALKDWSFYAY